MHSYLAFVALASLVALAPGPDSLLTLRNTVAGGRGYGLATMAGVSTACLTQGVLAALGLGAVIVKIHPLFLVIKWVGVAYLTYLGIMAIRAARHGFAVDNAPERSNRSLKAAARQGFLCNITNPKVLVFNLAVLPQFVGAEPTITRLLGLAVTLAAVGTLVLLAVVVLASAAAKLINRKRVRQGIEAGTGAVMLGFATSLALEA